jgi:hypothetical protein
MYRIIGSPFAARSQLVLTQELIFLVLSKGHE